MAKKLKLILAAFVAALTFGAYNFVAGDSVYADETEKAPIHIQVSPTKQKLALEPGSSYVGSFKVQNVGALEFTYTVSATPYAVTNEEYDPNYDQLTSYNQISKWITFDKDTESGKLQPGETVDVAFTVNVPEDAPAGGQYAALMAQTEDGNDESANIQVVHRVGMILYATVPGATRATGEIISNNINSFFFNPPISMSSLVKNTGNIEQSATYTYNIWPLFSNEAIFSNAESPQTLDIMQDTSRFNSISWEGAPHLGIFTVEQTIEFAGQVSTNKKLVVICPLWLLFLIFVLIFFMIFWLISRAKDRQRTSTKKGSGATAERKSEREE